MTLIERPLIIDDPGNGVGGTAIDGAWMDQLFDELDTLLHSTTNPSRSPAQTTDEVVAARGSLPSLAERLLVSLKADGTLQPQASLATVADLQGTLGAHNFWDDSRFEIWPAGDSAAPAAWTIAGTGAAVARSGQGVGDNIVPHNYGGYAAKLTFGSATATLTRNVLTSAEFPAGLQGRTIVIGIYVRASVANLASIIVDDGVIQTRGGEGGNGTYHDGDGQDGFLYATHTFDGSATKLDIKLEVAQSGSAYFSGGVLALSDSVPIRWFPERSGLLVMSQQQRGELATGTTLNEWRQGFPYKMGILLRTKIRLKTAPTDADLIYDVNKGGSSAYTTNLPTVSATATNNGSGDPPDGTYANRCFVEDNEVTFDCDQVGSTIAGEEATLAFLFKVPLGTFSLIEAGGL